MSLKTLGPIGPRAVGERVKAIQVQDYLFSLCGEVDVAAAVITVAKTTYWAFL